MRKLIALSPLLVLLAVACGRDASANKRAWETARVARHDIELTASATGVVEPMRTVEVKSKSSGEIVDLPVETGDYVRAGAVLAKLYPRDAQNQYAQAAADVEAAKARLMTAESEYRRSASLRDAALLPESTYETKRLEVANAQAQLIRARTSLDIASDRLRETVVIAPVSGRIIEKNVELGNVVSSAVSQVSGGTTLMKMADLREVQIRALVDETDIGKIKPGQDVRIKVDAFPGRRFRGTIYRIEPQAIVDQSVTMFPLLVRIPNEDELLKPGMNAEVDIYIDRHTGVLAIPNEAVKSPREAMSAAAAVGLTAEEVRAARGAEGAAPGGRNTAAAPDHRERRPDAAARTRTGEDRGNAAGAEGGRARAARGESGGAERAEAGIVFKVVDGRPTPVRISTGVANWDMTEVTAGLSEGDEVVVLPSGSLLRQQDQMRERMRGMSGVPGMGGGGTRR
ncbi:MAG: efflux RND transporter periplasmic adaptor subunit [Thermoanaerobaculia bacterium]